MTSFRRFTAAVCAVAVGLQGATPLAWAQETIAPMVGIHGSWGGQQPVALRLGVGLQISDAPPGRIQALQTVPIGADSYSAYVPIGSLPLMGAADPASAIDTDEILAADQKGSDQKSSGKGAVIGVALVLGGLAAIALIGERALKKSLDSGSGSG
ncbi:hypothetical protein SAMN04488120_1015 [Fontimonas thermophila]|uniref:Uncharacterized protein n=1 Tax=Fontimonas thermophila TaxID=1076937 RepID=A0A1I2GXT9_9GAMM|nr:hypothetical protein [Fontimonas thermophila]SFF21973.1 hypothetical protein SAMN04488120_1015 [Fontimonas thermophila]